MRKALLIVSVAVFGLSFGCGGGRSGVKPAPPSVSTFTDTRNGQVYRIVQIGRQIWFAENLNYAAEGSVCYDNKNANCAKYGRLYDWNTAMKACPAGTHLPTMEEWDILEDYVGGYETSGTKLKSSKGWKNDEEVPAGTDNYGFSALPGGDGDSDSGFNEVGYIGSWWSATDEDMSWPPREIKSGDTIHSAWFRGMSYDDEEMSSYGGGKVALYSVRCVLDKGGKQ